MKNLSTWTEVLFCDSDLLPDGRGLEATVVNKAGKAVKLSMRQRVKPQSHAWEGYVSGKQICRATDAKSCAEFLVDWVRAS